MELPSGFRERMEHLLGEEYEAFLNSYEQERAQGLRLNLLKTRREEFLERCPFHLRPIPWAGSGYFYEPQDRPGRHPYHEAGVYYIQEPSAMAVVTLLDPRPGESILDLCAAPGGKTSHIASCLEGRGFLLTNEIHPSRAKILSQNVERMGVRNAVVTNEDSERLSRYFTEFFDRIAVDAPCSGEGMFRKDEEAVRQWSPGNVALCAARQQEILHNASVMLKPGGRLVYSTCTFAPEEDERAVVRFLEAHRDFCLVPAKRFPGFSAGVPAWAETKDGAERAEETRQEEMRQAEMRRAEETRQEETRQAETRQAAETGTVRECVSALADTVRIWPHRTEGEGHFIAVMERRGGQGIAGKRRKVPAYLTRKPQERPRLQDFYRFCRETLVDGERFAAAEEYVLFGDQLYLVPPQMPDFTGLKVVRPGLHMGTLKKNRFEPSHALALALCEEDAVLSRRFAADAPQTERYLKGEALPDAGEGSGRKKGWVLITVDGYSLGWAKLAGGILKNHYPKGLRRQ